MANIAEIKLDNKTYELPVVVGSEGEKAIDISTLRDLSGYITLDTGFKNTGSTQSAITFLDGENGILRYRGYPIEQLAEKSNFLEVSYLLIYGELPNKEQLASFISGVTHHTLIHEDMKKFYEGFPSKAHPMGVLASMIAAMSTFYPDVYKTEGDVDLTIQRLMAKCATVAAWSYKKSIGHPVMYPQNRLSYCANFLHMMFAQPELLYFYCSRCRFISGEFVCFYFFWGFCLVGTIAWRCQSSCN